MRRFILLFKLMFFLPSVVFAAGTTDDLSYEAYLEKIGAGERKIDYSQGLINHKNLHELIIERNGIKRPIHEEGSDVGGKHSEGREGQASSGIQGNVQSTTHVLTGNGGNDITASINQGGSVVLEKDINKSPISVDNTVFDKGHKVSNSSVIDTTPIRYVYIPPSLRGVQTQVSNDIQVKSPSRAIEFGIPIGTRIPVKLSTGASNVQPGYVQLTVQKDVVGDKKTLVSGSTIFCRANAVLGSPRLYTSSIRGITQDTHAEFSIKGDLFAEDGNAGLLAVVISDGRGLSRAKDAGVAVAGVGLLGLIPSADIATEAGKAAANVVLEENNDDNRVKNSRLNYVLEAAPQLAVLQIGETF